MLLALFLTVCPAPEAVELKLATLRPPGAAAPRYRLEVQPQEGGVVLIARDGEGAPWLRRTLPEAPCAELEAAAAVVLLAWEAQLAPGEVPVPEVPAVGRALPQGAKAEAAPGGLGWRVNAGGQFWLSSASPTWGAAGSVELHGRWLGLELGVLGQGRREVALGPGRASWSRFSAWLGPVATLRLVSGVDASVGLYLVGGVFQVAGTGFDTTRTVSDWDAGALVQAKVMMPGLWRLRPYVALAGAWWARRHVVEARAPDAAVVLPFLEASPSVGLVFTP